MFYVPLDLVANALVVAKIESCGFVRREPDCAIILLADQNLNQNDKLIECLVRDAECVCGFSPAVAVEAQALEQGSVDMHNALF